MLTIQPLNPLLASTPVSTDRFSTLDTAVLVLYALVLFVSGIIVARRKRTSSGDYFLAARSMPAWAVAISFLATSLSAATFIGAPEQAYKGNLTYLAATVASIIAAFFVARFLIPIYYRAGVTTVYELLETRLGGTTRTTASLMYMLGRVLANGSRIYIAAIPTALILHGDVALDHLTQAILILICVGILYTFVGGISSVIWTDVVQTIIFVGAALTAVIILLWRIPISIPEIGDVLSTSGPDGTSKLTLFEFTTDWSSNYSVGAILIGMVLFNVAAYGMDHDMTQRLLTCRDSRQGARSIMTAIIAGVPVTLIFMCIGLLLFVYYQRPEIMGRAAPAPPTDDSRQIFLTFILDALPSGVRGLMMAGLFATALSTVNSSLNAMSSVLTNDLYRRWVPEKDEHHYLKVGRIGIVFWGVVLGWFAIQAAMIHHQSETTLIDFALGIMIFPYAGLLGVFLTLIFTNRGNTLSAMLALIIGLFLSLYLAPGIVSDAYKPEFYVDLHLAYPWRLTLATMVATAICMTGPPAPTGQNASA